MPTEINFTENSADYTPLSAYYAGKAVLFDRVKRFATGKRAILTEKMEAAGHFKKESLFVQYSKSYFEAILFEMQQTGADGVRIYFSEYENNPAEPASGQLGLIMLLTKTNNEGRICPVYLEEDAGFKIRLENSKSKGIDTTHAGGNGKPREIDVCRPCPPACPDQEYGFPEDGLS